MAEAGATIVIIGRSQQKLVAARNRLLAAVPAACLRMVVCDISNAAGAQLLKTGAQVKMRNTYLTVVLAIIATTSLSAQLPAPKPLDPNPWNGSWKLNVQRSSAVASEDGVPQVYRFALGPGPAADLNIKWEIPELGEVVTGRTNGVPMPVVRTKPSPGLTLSARTEGSVTLLYSVSGEGKLVSGGRMMLVDNGNAWVDLTWPADRQDLASILLYVKE